MGVPIHINSPLSLRRENSSVSPTFFPQKVLERPIREIRFHFHTPPTTPTPSPSQKRPFDSQGSRSPWILSLRPPIFENYRCRSVWGSTSCSIIYALPVYQRRNVVCQPSIRRPRSLEINLSHVDWWLIIGNTATSEALLVYSLWPSWILPRNK